MKKIRSCILFVLVAVMLLSVCASAWGDAKTIGREAALQAALDDAGLSADQVMDVDVEFERGRRSAWYELDFEAEGFEYEYRVDAYTGEILRSKQSAEERVRKTGTIGRKAALRAALDDAGLSAGQVTDIDVELERGFRSVWYEVDFELKGCEYEYRVDAYTGEILRSSVS